MIARLMKLRVVVVGGQIHLILSKPINVPTQWMLPLKAELEAWIFVEIVCNLDGKTADSGLGFPSTSNTSATHSIHLPGKGLANLLPGPADFKFYPVYPEPRWGDVVTGIC
jgi:hypothetical protein